MIICDIMIAIIIGTMLFCFSEGYIKPTKGGYAVIGLWYFLSLMVHGIVILDMTNRNKIS
jgi:hypothetical protein